MTHPPNAAAPGPPRRQLWRLCADLAFGLAEAVAVVLPLLALDRPAGRAVAPLLLRLSPVALCLFGLAALGFALLRPGRPALHGLWLRVALAVGASGVFAALLARLGLPGDAALLLLGAALLYTPLIDAFRVLLLDLRRGRRRERESAQRSGAPFLDDLHARMVVASLCTSAPAAVCTLALSLAPTGLTPDRLARLHILLPPVTLALFFLWSAWLAARLRAVAAVLAPASSTLSDDELHRALRSAQRLPYDLGVSKVLLWSAAATLTAVFLARSFRSDPDGGILLIGETTLVIVGAALYEVPWQRANLVPLLARLAQQRPGLQPPRALPLRLKLVVAFGSLIVLSCGLALLWSTQQHRAVSDRYARGLCLQRLAALQGAASAVPASALRGLLAAHARGGVIAYRPAPGAVTELFGAAPDDRGARPGDSDANDPEPRYQPATPHHACGGALTHSDGAPRGRVVLFLPSSGPRVEEAAIIASLIGFFLLLLLGALGILALIAADLTRPIRELERRASDVAGGDLRRPLLPVPTESDELGRLQHAFEGMRETLAERLRSSTEIHYMLEAQVGRRTAELSRRNRELQEALDALQRAQTELLDAERMASIGQLIAGIAHEINNPVNAVLNAAGPLLDALEDRAAGRDAGALADLWDMVRVIQRGARRTREIVQALHHYARGDEASAMAPVDLARCLDESLELLRHPLVSGGIDLQRDYAGLPQPPGSAGQLQQVFMNLIINAAQALRGAPAPRITLRGSVEPDASGAPEAVLIDIADNGPGIPPEIIPRIFDPFFTTKEVGQGSGLGLSIVHGILARHGATIHVDSAVGQGTTMRVRLPLRPSTVR